MHMRREQLEGDGKVPHESGFDADDPESPFLFQLHALPLLLLIFVTAWIRIPTLHEGMPYFEREDEAHHFNRTVQMVQSGDFNPHYFHKPSLHFYLRMPVVAASFLYGVSKGELRKIGDIETRDRFGLGGYAFTASHPLLVKHNRAFSVLLMVGSAVLTYGIMFFLTQSSALALFVGLLFSLSPNAYLYATTIGVDIVVTFFALLTAYLALTVYRSTSAREELFRMFLTALSAGLAVSSKYNALPIVAVPFFCSFASLLRLRERFLIVLFGVPLGFLLGTPYLLKELPLFLDHFAYEIWHYGLAGHVGHEAEPGWSQALFYGKWLFQEGLGVVGGGLALLGIGAIFFLITRSAEQEESKSGMGDIGRAQFFTVALFPLLFIVLMIFQRTNFTRNMLVVVPFLAIFAGLALFSLLKLRFRFRGTFLSLIVVAALLPLAYTLSALRAESKARVDSRDTLLQVIAGEKVHSVCHGRLWLSRFQVKQIGCREVGDEELSHEALFLQGVERVIVPSSSAFAISLLQGKADAMFVVEQEIPGQEGEQRIVLNPAITIFRRAALEVAQILAVQNEIGGDNSKSAPPIVLQGLLNGASPQQDTFAPCTAGAHRNDGEGACWTTRIVEQVEVEGDQPVLVGFSSPWRDQEIVITNEDGVLVQQWKLSTGEDPKIFEFTPGTSYRVITRTVRSPLEMGLSEDNRLLGVSFEGRFRR